MGRPRAEEVMPEDTLGNMLPGVAAGGQQFGRRQAGSIKQNNGNYAFIAQDNGEADMFAMPYQCSGFDGALPPVGARVVYNVGVDQKSGRPRAEDSGQRKYCRRRAGVAATLTLTLISNRTV